MKYYKLLGIPVLIVSLALFPALSPKNYFIFIATLTGIYLILALSYDLMVGHLGAISLGHPAFFGLGAYAAGILSNQFGTPFLVNLLIGASLAGTFAVALGFPAFQLGSFSFAMGTLGIAIVAQLIAKNWVGVTGGPRCMSKIPPVRLGGPGMLSWSAQTPADDYFVTLALTILAIVAIRQIVLSRVGRAFHAIREDPILASGRGINLLYYRISAFAISAAFAAVAGVLYAHIIRVICPSVMAVDITLTLLIIVFLGGVASMPGIIIGAIIFTFVPEYLRISAVWRPIIYGTLLLIVITRAPEGIAGLIEKSWRNLSSKVQHRRMPKID